MMVPELTKPEATLGSRPTPRVVVVEDEALISMDIEIRLQNLGYEVIGVAASATEALAVLERGVPDIVLMDINIKGAVDGIELAQMLRERYDLPSIFVTAYSDDSYISRAMLTRALGFLSKPFSDREVRAAIEIGLYREGREKEIHRQRDELERLNRELIETRGQLRSMTSLLPMCSWCKSIRDDAGYWQNVRDYLETHIGHHVTDGICQTCAREKFGVDPEAG